MEEIDLKDMFRYFLSKILIIIIITIIALALGICYMKWFQTPLYKSYTTILLTKEDSDSTITYTDINLNKNLVDTYSEIIKSKKISKQVINNLNLSITADKLISKTTVESVNDTELIKITVVDEDSSNAKVIANEIARVFSNEVVNYFNLKNIGIVDTAEEAENPYNINMIKQIVLYALIGIVLGFGIVFIMYYFDTTVKSKNEIEAKLLLPVIGEVPDGGARYE